MSWFGWAVNLWFLSGIAGIALAFIMYRLDQGEWPFEAQSLATAGLMVAAGPFTLVGALIITFNVIRSWMRRDA